MEKDPFSGLDYRSGILDEDEGGGDPFAGLYPTPHSAPLPPRRPADLTEPEPTDRTPAEPPEPTLRWSDVPGMALKNAIPSAKAAALGAIEPIRHPLDTMAALGQLGKGALSKASGALGYPRAPEDEKTLDALGQFYKDRFGSEEKFKKALAEDPVGVAADASSFIGGGGSLLGRLPGMAGRAGEAISATGRAIHPLNAAATVAAPAMLPAMSLLNYPLSIKSGAPVPALQRALKAGWKGSEPFREQIGGADPTEIVNKAHDAVSEIARQRRKNYLAGMANVAGSANPIDYSDINKALRDALKDVTHGSKTYKREAGAMLQDLWKEVRDWQSMPNTSSVNYHNVEGVDKLKQLVGELRANAKPGSPADAVATKIYNSIRDTLGKHDPNYLKVMEDYGDLSDQLKQLKTTLSINPRASVDTTLRKLLLGDKQKDGAKGKLLKDLAKVDPEISDMIAGHLLSSWIPTGFTGGIGAALSAAHGLGAYSGAAEPVSAVAGALASSPRVVGHVNYGVGRMAHPGGGLPLMVTTPFNIADDANNGIPAAEEPREERPYFPGEDEDTPARPGRATGGKVGITADRLIAMAKASRRKIQLRSKAILSQPDEHVVGALRAVNKEMQGN